MIPPKEKDLYAHIILTEEEKEEGDHERRKKKYFHEKHGDYWEEKEKVKKGKDGVSPMKNE